MEKMKFQTKEQAQVGQRIEQLCAQGKNDQAMHVLRDYYGDTRVEDYFYFDAIDKPTAINMLEIDLNDTNDGNPQELCKEKLRMVKSHDDKMFFAGDDLTEFIAMNDTALINALHLIPV